MPSILASFLLLQGCASLPEATLRDAAYVANGGPRQQGDLYLPSSKFTGPHPVALVLHGGGWVGRDRSDMKAVAQQLAKHGFAAFNINYRLAPEHTFPAQLEDAHAALRYLSAHANQWNLDTTKIATVGYSAGAHLALLAAEITDPKGPKVQAIVAGGAPTDLLLYPESPYINQLIGASPKEARETWEWASPIQHVTPKHPPVFLFHARWDQLVELKNATRMKEALTEAGVSTKLNIRNFSGHLILGLYMVPPMKQGIAFLKHELSITE